MNNPLVTIITVCYNAAALIEETIQSVLSQDYPNLEYLIVDGASTDGTLDIVRKYADRVKFVSEPDKGIYDAMNKGLKMAKGEWVNFMNAGDTFSDDHVLSDIFHGEIPNHVHIIGGHVEKIYPDHKEPQWAENPSITRYTLPYCHQATFMRIGNWQFDTNFKIAADYKVMYDCFWRYGEKSMLSVDRVIANYRMEDSTTFDNLRKAKAEYLKIQSNHKTWIWWKEYIKWILHKS